MSSVQTALNCAIHRLLTEGRKYHLSFCGATQDYYANSTAIGATMGKADMQVFLKPTVNSLDLVARKLHIKQPDFGKLECMGRGDCFIKADVYNPEIGDNEPTIISGKITAL